MSDEDDVPMNGDTAPTRSGEVGASIRVGKRVYAVGLLWSRSEDAKKMAAEAKAEAKEVGADLVAYRKESRQYALARKSEGFKPGQPSLAAALADVMEGSFVGVFPVEGGFYLCAVQNGTVLAGQDRLIADREAALDEFGMLQAQGNWDYAFSPTDFGFERSLPQSLEDLLGNHKPKVVLSEISPKTAVLKLGLLLLGLGVAYLAYGQYSAWHEAREQERLEREAAEAEAARLAAEQAAREARDSMRVQIPPMPWDGKAAFADSLQRCLQGIFSAPTSVPGWRPSALSCTGEGEIRLSLQRDGGTMNWVAPFVNRDGFRPRIVADAQGGTVTGIGVVWNVGLEGLPRFNSETPTVGVSEARRHVQAWSEELFLQPRFTDVPGVTAEIAGPNNQPQQVPVSRGIQFGFSIQANPADLLHFLSAIPVTTLERVTLDMSNSRQWTWNIEGVTHERIPLPPDARPFVRQSSPLGIPGR